MPASPEPGVKNCHIFWFMQSGESIKIIVVGVRVVQGGWSCVSYPDSFDRTISAPRLLWIDSTENSLSFCIVCSSLPHSNLYPKYKAKCLSDFL